MKIAVVYICPEDKVDPESERVAREIARSGGGKFHKVRSIEHLPLRQRCRRPDKTNGSPGVLHLYVFFKILNQEILNHFLLTSGFYLVRPPDTTATASFPRFLEHVTFSIAVCAGELVVR